MRSFAILCLALVVSCADTMDDQVLEIDLDAGSASDTSVSNGSNQGVPDGGSALLDATTAEADMGISNPTDTGVASPDMDDADAGADMLSMQWPEYSGVSCNVNGAAGRCLPTASCDGVATPGHCPGPAGIQCCVTSCSVGSETGVCTSESTCSTATPTSSCAGPAGVGCCTDSTGDYWGTAYNTYYYLSDEDDFSGPDNTALNDVNCNPIAQVPAAYSDAACIEGSGILEDGTVVNYAATCNCGRPCPTGGIVCWKALDKNTYPWGQGAFSNPLVPMRSLAVDRNEIPLRTAIYLPKFDGVQVPAIGGVAAFTHDGCFRADDVGGAINGEHIDIFTGPTAMRTHFETVFPTRTNFDIFLNVAKCQ